MSFSTHSPALGYISADGISHARSRLGNHLRSRWDGVARGRLVHRPVAVSQFRAVCRAGADHARERPHVAHAAAGSHRRDKRARLRGRDGPIRGLRVRCVGHREQRPDFTRPRRGARAIGQIEVGNRGPGQNRANRVSERVDFITYGDGLIRDGLRAAGRAQSELAGADRELDALRLRGGADGDEGESED
ncbi:unannotated protein [freshwater metagenome]|uniref:Unannotated protein n=1 Tax=freshwater metagenome TaxID=449393 RepID=A0A6J6Z919_9ZZZZ